MGKNGNHKLLIGLHTLTVTLLSAVPTYALDNCWAPGDVTYGSTGQKICAKVVTSCPTQVGVRTISTSSSCNNAGEHTFPRNETLTSVKQGLGLISAKPTAQPGRAQKPTQSQPRASKPSDGNSSGTPDPSVNSLSYSGGASDEFKKMALAPGLTPPTEAVPSTAASSSTGAPSSTGNVQDQDLTATNEKISELEGNLNSLKSASTPESIAYRKDLESELEVQKSYKASLEGKLEVGEVSKDGLSQDFKKMAMDSGKPLATPDAKSSSVSQPVSDSCRNSGALGISGCNTTKTVISSFQATSAATDMAGQIAGTISSGVAQNAASSGKMSDTYFAAGNALEAGSIAQYSAGAVNVAAAITTFVRARKHGSNIDEINDMAGGQVDQVNDQNNNHIGISSNNAATQRAISSLSEYSNGFDTRNADVAQNQIRGVTSRATTEQEDIKAQADLVAAAFMSKGAAQIAGGISSKIQADQNYAMGALTRANEGAFGDTTYNSSATSSEQVVPNVDTPSSDNAYNGNISDATSPTSAGDPNNYGSLGGPPLLTAPTAGAGAGPSSGGNGGSGGGLGGGGTSPATEEKSSDATSLAHASKQPFYSGGNSGAYTSGGKSAPSASSGKGGIGDLAAMLANAFGKKPEDKDKSKSILDFDRQAQAAANASLLSPEVNIFSRIHDAYQEKQKTNVVGLIQFNGRALASQPGQAGAHK